VKISIITVCYNSEKTISETINSVIKQTHPYIEYIIIDGGSTDNTLSIINKYSDYISAIISEKDDGMYDAMNKGISYASGDIIGILNSDDVFAYENVVSNIVEVFIKRKIKVVWGDVAFVDNRNRIRRLYSGDRISRTSFNHGIMPPHPSVFIKKECYDIFGNFNIKYKIASDYDLLLRFLNLNNLKYYYFNKILVKMKIGGKSNQSIRSIIALNKEIYEIHYSNGIPISIFNLLKKVPRRILELFYKPK